MSDITTASIDYRTEPVKVGASMKHFNHPLFLFVAALFIAAAMILFATWHRDRSVDRCIALTGDANAKWCISNGGDGGL